MAGIKFRKYSKHVLAAVLYAVAAWFGFKLYENVRRSREEGSYVLVANIRRTDELKVGADVRLSGINVGRISKMELLPDFSVDVVMQIRLGVLIPDDSVAAIYTEGFLGPKYVAIVTGGSEEQMQDGDNFIYTQDSINMFEMLEAGIDNFSRSREGR